MKNRLCTLGRHASLMLLIVASCAVTSCKDEYTLDDEKPSWLGKSIYESLQESGYDYYLRLLSDPDVNPANARPLTEVLSRTGSKTVFVANDEAWERFFQANAQLPESDPWHTATSYENLSVNQKKLLIHTSMLNNAIVMENLASSEGGNIQRGMYMRRYTDVALTDSITYIDANSLPISYNEELTADGKECETDYWWRFRNHDHDGIYLVSDASSPMMVFFTREYLSKNNITDEDFAIIMGKERLSDDVHIYGSRLNEKDQTTENGYINTTEDVIKPLPNMAEAIRTNGKTRIFSHMLERWCAPYPNSSLTEAYRNLMAARGIEWKEKDTIFSKRYFSKMSYGGRQLDTGPKGELFQYGGDAETILLKFDPGWNGLYTEKGDPHMDMSAMYIPNDDALWKYFGVKNEGGWLLIQTYCDPNVEYSDAHTEEDYQKLFHNIDQIPLNKLQPLIYVIQFNSFEGSVPSKMTSLRDDANEQLFYPEDKQHIQSTLLANNGVVYIMDKVYGPADYNSVAAPAFINKDSKVVSWAIYNGMNAQRDYMGLHYYAYLKAMRSKFALFLPNDEAMRYYYEPVSFKSQMKRLIDFHHTNKTLSKDDATFPIEYAVYGYNNLTGEIGEEKPLESMDIYDITNRMKDILESHTIVLEGFDEIDTDQDNYYLTKNGAAIKVTRENGEIVKVQGGFQLENEEKGIEGSISSKNRDAYKSIHGLTENNILDRHKKDNGRTYILDSPIIPASRSVYNILTNDGNNNDEDFQKFYELCEVDEDIIKACGLVNELEIKNDNTKMKAAMKNYQIFIDDNGLDYNVQFFNNYRYTVFVPTPSSISQAIDAGLPTWEEIKSDYQACEKNEQNHLVNSADSLRLKAKITYLINFVRYHFSDNSIFADKSQFTPREYVTASYDSKRGLFSKLYMRRTSSGGETILQVQDATNANVDDNGNVRGTNWITVSGRKNIMARDIRCNTSPKGSPTMNNIRISASSFAVIHQIPEVLFHAPIPDFNNTTEAKKYLKRYAIH